MEQSFGRSKWYSWVQIQSMRLYDAGCNFNAIESVYGKEFLGRSHMPVSLQKLNKNQMKNINIHEQQTFKKLCGKLCYTYTKLNTQMYVMHWKTCVKEMI